MCFSTYPNHFAEQFYNIVEMKTLLFQTVDFGTLINLSATDYASWALAADIISGRRNRFFLVFMGTSHSFHFRRLIETTGALVFNVVPYLCMLPDDNVNLSPLRMDIAIPTTSFTLWFVFLRLVGYESHGEMPMNEGRTSGTTSIWRFKKNSVSASLLAIFLALY
jgi:hypothetical protein